MHIKILTVLTGQTQKTLTQNTARSFLTYYITYVHVTCWRLTFCCYATPTWRDVRAVHTWQCMNKKVYLHT
jgi:hypothetical protein